MSAPLAIALGLLPLPALLAGRARWPGWLVLAVALLWLGTALATLIALPRLQHGAVGMAPMNYYAVIQGHYVISLALLFLAAGAIYLALSRFGALIRPGLSALLIYAAHGLMLVPLYISATMAGMTLPRRYEDYTIAYDRANEWAESAILLALIAAGGFIVLAFAGIIVRLRGDGPDGPPDAPT